jgi:peptide-methionine (S)-S-oxide reductase
MKLHRLLALILSTLFTGATLMAADKPPKPETDLPAGKAGETRTAIFAGGCFWCTEAVYRQLKGVSEVVSGYSGGTKETADYDTVCTGTTNHAESIRIKYDPSQISYGQLLQVFFTAHDPTTLNSQGPDHGRQYRSAIFYENAEEKKVAEAYIKQLNDAKLFPKPIVTALEERKEFYPAEAYHQNFVALNPTQGYVMQCSLPKVQKVRATFADWLKKDEKKEEKK